MARDLALGMLVGLLVAAGLWLLLTVEPSVPRVELPKSSPRPNLLDQPYRPRAPTGR